MCSIKFSINNYGSNKKPCLKNGSLQTSLHDIIIQSESRSATDKSNASTNRFDTSTLESANKGDSENGTRSGEYPTLLYELEEEIERQLEAKARKTDFTVTNVKSLIKAVISSEDIRSLIDYHLNMSKVRPRYNVKLTRAKIREILLREFSSALPLLLKPLRKLELAELIYKELPDDSSDEEYNPQDDVSDGESKLDDSLIEDLSGPVETTVQNVLSRKAFPSQNPTSYESIGQRTRSKLSLSETPLEAIEQAFIPPDITSDMYNTDCENPDWLDFLKEFTQPLSETIVENNDDENDPEYNVMVDEEHEHEHEDNEEMRDDRAVKVSKKELYELMTEVHEYTQNLSSDEDENYIKSMQGDENYIKYIQGEIKKIEEHARYVLNDINDNSYYKSIIGEKATEESPEETTSDKDCVNKSEEKVLGPIEKPQKVNFLEEQIFLLNQQMRQQVQLSAVSFLLTYGHPLLDKKYSNIFKSMVDAWVNIVLEGNNIFENIFELQLLSLLNLMKSWEGLMNDPVQTVELKRFLQKETATAEYLLTKKVFHKPELPQQLIQLCKRSSAILYPLLLPTCGFLRCYPRNRTLLQSEINLIVYGMDEYLRDLGNKVDERKGISDMAKYIKDKIPSLTTHLIAHCIKRSRSSTSSNPVRCYMESSTLPNIVHYVVPFLNLMNFNLQPRALLPKNWQ